MRMVMAFLLASVVVACPGSPGPVGAQGPTMVDALLRNIYDRAVVDSYIDVVVGYPAESTMAAEWMAHHDAAEVVVKP